MNLASNYVFIICYHALTIVQSFLQEFAKNSFEKLPGILKPTSRDYFPALFVVPVLLRLHFNYFIVTVIREPHYLYTVGPRWFELGYFEFIVISKKTTSLGFALQSFTIGYFELPLFRTIFCLPWEFQIARFNCRLEI